MVLSAIVVDVVVEDRYDLHTTVVMFEKLTLMQKYKGSFFTV